MKIFLIALLIVAVFSPEIIKFIRIKHMKSLGYRYEGDKLVRIQTNDNQTNRK